MEYVFVSIVHVMQRRVTAVFHCLLHGILLPSTSANVVSGDDLIVSYSILT